MKALEWLAKPYPKSSETILARISELVTVNGGFNIGAWGFIASGGISESNPYGREGLEREEALELIHLFGILVGFEMAGAGTQAEVCDAIKAEQKRVWEIRKKEMEPETTPTGN